MRFINFSKYYADFDYFWGVKSISSFKPTLSQSWLIALFLVIGSLLVGLIVGALQLFFPVSLLKCESLSYLVCMLFPFAYILAKSAEHSGEEGTPLSRNSFGRLGVCAFTLLAILGMLSLGVLTEPLTAFIPMPDSVKNLFEAAFRDLPLWDGIVSACILAPLCEEFLCRGMMLRGMLCSGVSPRAAIIWSAFIFAAMHMNPWQALPAFVLGAFFGWVYYQTGALWLTILLHCVNNSMSTYLTRAFDSLEIDDGLIDILPTGQYILLYCLCAALFAAVILIFRKNEKTLSV